MKKVSLYIVLLFAVACTSFDSNPYGDALRTLKVRIVYPDDYAEYLREGVKVSLADRNTDNCYTALTDAAGCVEFVVTSGHYRLSVADKPEASKIFNGSVEQIDLARSDAELDVALKFAKPGSILIKEIYTGGCPMDAPATGAYTYDKYVILHNNNPETLYLDGLCLCMVAPYVSTTQNNPWTSVDGSGNIVFKDFAPVPDCIWQFGGEGADFPLAPGQDAVVAMNGAVDHTQTYSLSVNLNQKDFFVLYDYAYYPDTRSHPTPGDQIQDSHNLKVLKKTGVASTKVYTISNNSPAVILFRAPEDFDLDAYLKDDMKSTDIQGSIIYSKIPWDWVIDGAEVFDGSNATKSKRLQTDVDAGAVNFSGKSQGHTLHRVLDEEATADAGFEVYVDTNNSANDFYERATQSLHK